MLSEIQLLENRVMVEPDIANQTTSSGLYIPESAQEKPRQGKVISIGNGKPDSEILLKVGDKVLYGKYSGTEIEFNGKNCLIMRDTDIIGIIKS